MSVLIDFLLAILTIYLAIQCLVAPRLTQTVFMFFAFGLALALAWVRLGAVDVAITEAAVASGFLGVLFLDALRDFSFSASSKQVNSESDHQGLSRKNKISRLVRSGPCPGIGSFSIDCCGSRLEGAGGRRFDRSR
ncbi:Na(+)/H(+) antiporter subunit B [Geofilum rubicundum]|uniref:Na(+) H(+) antiporter subunit A n=1 Tax=Geofilum rubicundum JCM 15548 TaxID=1236989 RepID=A0A0E9LXD0_9BACT|nr:DUF4040 domain-containing protein [Geofilum rubicundum]GAO29948.1 Na(+) H(+) antiporter subunit A [Geofilum rubicundum JCM 15548]